MKFVYPSINYVFDTENNKVNTLVIENPPLLYALIEDIQNQLSGLDGKSVLSINGEIKAIDKNVELLSDFIPFDINKKTLIGKISARLENVAENEEYYSQTSELLSGIESFLLNLSYDCMADLTFSKCNIGSIIKAVSPRITDDFSSLSEKIIEYMELVYEFNSSEKLFITLNLRSFIGDDEANLLLETVLSHGFHCLMIESSAKKLLDYENRVIVDIDLCEIF